MLEKALARGRRQVPVKDLCRDLELTREDVLGWLKANAARQPELALQYPPEPERVAVVKLAGGVVASSRRHHSLISVWQRG